MATGIADSPNVAVNTAPIAAIGSEQPVAPALNDFMAAFRSGFITVDDLTRRTKQSVTDTSNLQTTLSANDLTRRKIAADTSLLPGQLSEAQTQQEIQATTAPARLATATKQAKDAELLATDPDAFHAQRADDTVREAWIMRKGPLPKTITIKNPEKPPTLVEWTQTQIPQIEARQQELAAQFANDEAGYVAAMRADDVARQQEYLDFVASNKEIKVPQGTPAYAEALQKQVQDLLQKEALSGASFSTYQKGQEAEAVARGTAAGKAAGGGDPEDRAKNEAVVAKAALDSKPIQKYLNAFQSIQQVREVAKQPPSNINDISILYSFVKALDPESAVREGEIDLVKASRTIPEKFLSAWKQLKADPGFLFTPAQRQEIINSSEISLRGFGAGAVPEVNRVLGNAQALGVNPARVMNSEVLSLVSPTAASAATSQGAGAPTKLPNGTEVPVGGSVRNPDGTVGKWTGTGWILVQ